MKVASSGAEIEQECKICCRTLYSYCAALTVLNILSVHCFPLLQIHDAIRFRLRVPIKARVVYYSVKFQGSGLKKYCTLRGSFDTDSCHVSQTLSSEFLNNLCRLFSILSMRRGFQDLFMQPKSVLEKHYAYIWKWIYSKAILCFHNQRVYLTIWRINFFLKKVRTSWTSNSSVHMVNLISNLKRESVSFAQPESYI